MKRQGNVGACEHHSPKGTNAGQATVDEGFMRASCMTSEVTHLGLYVQHEGVSSLQIRRGSVGGNDVLEEAEGD